MQVYDSIVGAALDGPTFLTIGNFDGVHRGHQALITAMQQEARASQAAAGLLTFHPHPRAVLRPDQPVASLTSLSERLALYTAAGLDFTVVHPFTQATAQTSAGAFLKLLHDHLGVSQLWVGPDFALGKGREGDIPYLREQGKRLGLEVVAAPEFYWEGQAVRSSRIRRLIEIGNVAWAANWLGRFYTVQGVVVHGAQRGRKIGFPTANLSLPQGRVVPANGVYAAWATVDEKRFPAVANIGFRPTLNGSHRTIEAHIIDFDDDLYGHCVQLAFVERLRDEIKFTGVDALTAQIARDRDRAAALLKLEPSIAAAPRFQEIPHTADWALHINGDSQAELFANAALAMFSLQDAAEIDGPTIRQRFEIEGADREDLLVRWLNELLWQAETQGVSFQSFFVELITDDKLRAEASGRLGRSPLAHIKAVTYHDLAVTPPRQNDTLWTARVLFDT